MKLSLRVGVVITPLLLACSGTDATAVTRIQTTNPYTRLQLNVRAAVMSTVPPYDTLQLIPTAYDANGDVIPLPGPVTYTVNDTTIRVNPAGLMTVLHKTGTSSYVIASVQDTAQRLTHKDTVFILGTTTVPVSPLTSFSIHPIGSDSAVLDVHNGTKALTVTALDATGKNILSTSLKVHYASKNVGVSTINAQTGVITTIIPGMTHLTASTTYYGVTKTDSLDFRVGYQDTMTIKTQATALPDGTYRYSWTISNPVTGVGKAVIFAIPDLRLESIDNFLYAGNGLPVGDPRINEGVHVVFDDSSAAQASMLPATWLTAQFASTGTGNIDLQVPDSVIVVDTALPSNYFPNQESMKFTNYCRSTTLPCATARAFYTPGTYHFTSTTTGATGTLTVVAP